MPGKQQRKYGYSVLTQPESDGKKNWFLFTGNGKSRTPVASADTSPTDTYILLLAALPAAGW